MTLIRRLCSFLAVSALFASGCESVKHETCNIPRLTWVQVPDLPEPTGLKGMFGGVSNNKIIIAGGSHFPVPRSAGGKKQFSNRIFIQSRDPNSPDGNAWQIARSPLPQGLGEGACVVTERGLVAIGGNSGNGPVDSVLLLTWNNEHTDIRITKLPTLPESFTNAAAVYLNGKIFLAGGESRNGATTGFWVLDFRNAFNDSGTWKKLSTWPGPARQGAALAALKIQNRDYIFLLGGKKQSEGRTKVTDYLNDAYRYDPAAETWTHVASMPHPALLAATVSPSQDSLLVMGGSDGHDLENMASLGDRYRLPDRIMNYCAMSNTWTIAGQMPLGVASPAVLDLGGKWMIAGGEFSPAMRTPKVYIFEIKTKN